MSIESFIVRSMIRFLWGKYPHQVNDILNEQGKHVHSNPTKPKPPITGQTICGTSHTARMAGGEA